MLIVMHTELLCLSSHTITFGSYKHSISQSDCLHSSKASYPDLSELLVHHFLVITYMIHIDRTDLMLTFSCQFDILFEDETYAYKDRYMDYNLLLATKVVMEADTYMDLITIDFIQDNLVTERTRQS